MKTLSVSLNLMLSLLTSVGIANYISETFLFLYLYIPVPTEGRCKNHCVLVNQAWGILFVGPRTLYAGADAWWDMAHTC